MTNFNRKFWGSCKIITTDLFDSVKFFHRLLEKHGG